ncbi:MAG: hypothetical protein ACI4E1_09320 [Lachnospira sp.]
MKLKNMDIPDSIDESTGDFRNSTWQDPDHSLSMHPMEAEFEPTQPDQSRVIRDSINAINRSKKDMSHEQLKHAYTEMKVGTSPDIVSDLTDRLDSKSFQ